MRCQTYKTKIIMKKVISTVLLSFMAVIVFSQVQSDCEKSWGLDHYYKKDVAYLAFKRLYEIKSPDTNKIIIPQIYQDSIWKGLAAIYNAFSIEQRDSVFDIYCIHNTSQYGSPLDPGIMVELDTTFEWTSNWLNGNITTGYEELDAFLAEYNYFIQYADSNSNTVVLNSDMPINPNPVVDSLLFFNGIKDSHLYVVTSHGDKIEYSMSGNEQFFDFTLAWGDCMAGCSNRHKWSFKVNYSNCTVEYLGLTSNAGQVLPDPRNCNITSIMKPERNNSEVSIYPNPALNILNIACENITQIELWNIQREIKLLRFDKQNFVKLNVETLEPGLYLIIVRTENKSFVKKFIKK